MGLIVSLSGRLGLLTMLPIQELQEIHSDHSQVYRLLEAVPLLEARSAHQHTQTPFNPDPKALLLTKLFACLQGATRSIFFLPFCGP